MSEPVLCTAHSSQTGKPCQKAPLKGSTVCRSHGGKSPNGMAAAERHLSTERAAAAVVTYGLPVDIDPHDALMEEIARTAGHVRWLAEMVQEIQPDALIWGKSGTETHQSTGFQAGQYASVSHAAAPNIWLTLYQSERTHLVNVCKAAIGAGIEERRVRLAEGMGALLANVIESILEDLGMRDDPRVPAIVRRRLTLVAETGSAA